MSFDPIEGLVDVIIGATESHPNVPLAGRPECRARRYANACILQKI